jgi:hypothetical protein
MRRALITLGVAGLLAFGVSTPASASQWYWGQGVAADYVLAHTQDTEVEWVGCRGSSLSIGPGRRLYRTFVCTVRDRWGERIGRVSLTVERKRYARIKWLSGGPFTPGE